jgi:hypothetical protein
MKTFSSYLLLSCLLGISASAAADAQMCNDMYPADAYEAEERNVLIQDCLAAYAPEPTYEDTASEPAYYEGSVEDFVNEVPAEDSPPE